MDKSELRRRYLSKRRLLNKSQIQSRNQLIGQRLLNFVDWKAVKLVHVYLPILNNNEIDTFPMIKYLWSNFESVGIAVPKVARENQLEHYQLTEGTALKSNIWGIPEPVNAPRVEASDIDLVVAPMIIFDKCGHRIGYGKGYYDRFLANCRPATRKIGLCYFNPVRRIKNEPTDIAMDVVITPDGVWEF